MLVWWVFYAHIIIREMAERRRETGDERPLEELYEVKNPVSRKDSACSDTEREVSRHRRLCYPDYRSSYTII